MVGEPGEGRSASVAIPNNRDEDAEERGVRLIGCFVNVKVEFINLHKEFYLN